MKHIALLSIAPILLIASAASADVINGGFEDGQTLSSTWNVRGHVSVEQYHAGKYALLQEPGTGGISQLWQSILLPATPAANFLTFRYRFDAPRQTVRPRLLAAYSRKVHGQSGPTVDLDILAGDTECRSETINSPTTPLTIIAKFDRRVSLLNLDNGDVESDHGTLGTPLVDHDIVEIQISNVPHAARVNVAFPGVTDWQFPTPANGTDATFSIVVESGDYNGDGQTTEDDIAFHQADFPVATAVSTNTARADVNLDGTIDQVDRNDIQNLELPMDSMGCSSGRTEVNSKPPDSFLAFLLTDDDTGSLPAGLNLTDPQFNGAFLYEDGNGSVAYDPRVTLAREVDHDGMFAVTLDLSGVAAGQSARVVFALAAAANGKSSLLLLDDIALDCPGGWCCDPATGVGRPTDDGDDCTLDTCDPATGSILRKPSDTDAPVITCPPDTVVTDRAKRGPEFTGYATATDNCSDPTMTDPPSQFVEVGCPTVIHRFWNATDEAGNDDSCTQLITDLDSDAPFYLCLSDILEECYSYPKTCSSNVFDLRFGTQCWNETNLDPGAAVEPAIASGCTCSAAEVLTECFRQGVKDGKTTHGEIQSCVSHFSNELDAAGEVCETKGAINSCVAGMMETLLDYLLGASDGVIRADECGGGPTGTDICVSSVDCPSDFDATTYDCCAKNNVADPYGWCEYSTTPCP